jgi:hypothetical protein
MKQLLIVLVVVLLLALSATSVIAADKNFQVGLDYAFNAKIESKTPGSNETTIDCTGYRVTGEYLADKFKLGLNLGTLNRNDTHQTESFNELSGGYRIVNNIFATLTYYQQTWWGNSTTANMVGVDALFPVSDKFSIGGYYGTSLLGTSLSGNQFSGYTDPKCTVTLYGLKFIYQINDTINVNLKYRVDNSHFTATAGDITSQDNTYTWITLGVGYAF